MARKRDRIIALVIVICFFATSFGVSFGVIWQMIQDGKKKDNTGTTQESKNMLQGTKLKDFTPIAKIDALKSTDQQPGTGSEVKAGDTVTVDYTGAVAATGVIFQSSLDMGENAKPPTLKLDQVIKGWKDGIVGMKVGGKRRLLIPADQAYGANPPQGSGIPANADLVFDITLHNIGQ